MYDWKEMHNSLMSELKKSVNIPNDFKYYIHENVLDIIASYFINVTFLEMEFGKPCNPMSLYEQSNILWHTPEPNELRVDVVSPNYKYMIYITISTECTLTTYVMGFKFTDEQYKHIPMIKKEVTESTGRAECLDNLLAEVHSQMLMSAYSKTHISPIFNNAAKWLCEDVDE